jgi:hypothetical protein
MWKGSHGMAREKEKESQENELAFITILFWRGNNTNPFIKLKTT